MPKAVQFNTTFYSAGLPKYEAGKTYAESDETLRQIDLGAAESVNVKAAEIEAAAEVDAAPDVTTEKTAG